MSLAKTKQPLHDNPDWSWPGGNPGDPNGAQPNEMHEATYEGEVAGGERDHLGQEMPHGTGETFKYISQYSQEYIEMSEYYYGRELPYDVYCREFKKGTYLDSPQDIKELYSLFIFFMFFDMYTRTVHLLE